MSTHNFTWLKRWDAINIFSECKCAHSVHRTRTHCISAMAHFANAYQRQSINVHWLRIQTEREIPFIVPLSHSMLCNGHFFLYLHNFIVVFSILFSFFFRWKCKISMNPNRATGWLFFACFVTKSSHIANHLYSIKIIHGTDTTWFFFHLLLLKKIDLFYWFWFLIL